jgi:hypothetical protein
VPFFSLSWLILPLLAFISVASGFCSDAPAFDLAGPKVDVHVQRDGRTLPIAEVPNLLPGDRLWIHPDLPESQSAHYILIVAFLRGATNPPPPEWFKRVETWNRAVREEGVFVVVPPEAQQALIFLAPETGGDFSTLRNAVRGRPGAFVRATQDLQQASWDRLRLDAYLAEVKAVTLIEAQSTAPDPKILKDRTELAARSLGIRVDQQCFDKPTEQQAPCLIQHTDGLVLDDSNAQSIVNQMANGSAADMMNQLSYAPLAGAGQFSPYVGAIVDLARILSSIHTAKYQYIPALALPQKEQRDTLNLRLNVPPSFRDPKSVIVVALPPIGPGHPPQLMAAKPLQQQAPQTAYCATKPNLTLAADGAPLVFGTALAYDLVLHVETKAVQPKAIPMPPAPSSPAPAHPELLTPDPAPAAPTSANSPPGIDIPITPNPAEGGFVLDQPLPPLPESEVVAELRGKWGFDTFAGPKFHLTAPHAGHWIIPASDQNALITGREDTLHLQGESTLCVEDVEATLPEPGSANSKPVKLSWKSPKTDQIEALVQLKDAAPGEVMIAIHQYGLAAPEDLSLKAYAEAAALDHLTLSAGDKAAVLKGKRLDEVEAADLDGVHFLPSALNRVQDFDQLEMSANGAGITLEPGKYTAKVMLRDGRQLHVPATVDPARPQVVLLSKGEQHEEPVADPAAEPVAAPPVRLGSPNDLPLQGRLVIFLRSRVPAVFPRTEKIEIAATDSSSGSFQTTLSFADGSLILEDARTAVAVIDPLARFGPSAFGPVQLRAVAADGISGDWVPLGTLVRLPAFSAANALRCPRNPAKSCQLSGNNLFLVTAVSASPDMDNEVEVPDEFTGTSIAVPNVVHSAANGNLGTLYLRLRDDPETIQALSLPVSTTMPANMVTISSGVSPGQQPPAKTDPAVDPSPAATKLVPNPAPDLAPTSGPTASNDATHPHSQ